MQPFTQIFSGFVPPFVPTFLRAPLASAAGVGRADALYGSLAPDRSIASELLAKLGVGYRIGEGDLAQVPRTGAAVVVANHPHGLLDAALLATVLLGVRPDVKFLANGMLGSVPGIEELILPIDPFGSAGARAGNGSGLRRALQFLEDGGLLVIFPAGEVSHFQWRAGRVCDPAWNAPVARLLRIAQKRTEGLQVIPAFIAGRNSAAFQWAGLIHPRLRTAMLLRELLGQRDRVLKIRLGRKTAVASVLRGRTDSEAIAYLRWRTELLGSEPAFNARPNWPLRRRRVAKVEVAAPQPVPRLALEIASLGGQLLAESGALRVYVARAVQIPGVMAEIARLRELTFREAGEGTGLAEDRDEFDAHYEHLFVWNFERQEIVGAYRICSTEAGERGLYTATLFRYDDAFLRRLGPAYELGRSFVRKEYQRDFTPLLLLWRGIGKLVAAHPEQKTLFGPVSISSEYRPASRQIMAAFLRRFAWLDELAGLVRSRHPFAGGIDSLASDVDELSVAVSDIEEKPSGAPVLLRQYLKLGGKLLGFNVDPQFSNVVDGLIVVDLTKTNEKLLERYLGKVEAAEFLRFHELA